jgi:hypothetical protein
MPAGVANYDWNNDGQWTREDALIGTSVYYSSIFDGLLSGLEWLYAWLITGAGTAGTGLFGGMMRQVMTMFNEDMTFDPLLTSYSNALRGAWAPPISMSVGIAMRSQWKHQGFNTAAGAYPAVWFMPLDESSTLVGGGSGMLYAEALQGVDIEWVTPP